MTPSISTRTDLNQVILTGKVAQNPRFLYQPDGTPVLQFSLEFKDGSDVSNGSPDRNRPRRPLTKGDGRLSLIQIVALGKVAQSGIEVRSGQRLLVKGRLHLRRWQTPEGRSLNRAEVIASEFHPAEENESDEKRKP